jgi:hypothetical protein
MEKSWKNLLKYSSKNIKINFEWKLLKKKIEKTENYQLIKIWSNK